MSISGLPPNGSGTASVPPSDVVAISVQVGAGGYSIARAVAQKLSYAYYDWDITSKAIEMAGVSAALVEEAPGKDSLFDKVMNRMVLANVHENELPSSMISASFKMSQETALALSSDPYRLFIENVVDELAGNRRAVIVGHGACITLGNKPNVLKVLVQCSMATRVRRVMAERGVSLREATESLEQADRIKSAYMKATYDVSPQDPSLYDLVLSTDRLSAEACVDAIVAAGRGGYVLEAA